MLAACSKTSKPTDYNAEVERNFVDTCVAQGGDGLRPVCRCAYRRFEREIPYDRFARIDQRLADDPNASLPDDLVAIYTDCVVGEGGGSAGVTPTVPPTTVASVDPSTRTTSATSR